MIGSEMLPPTVFFPERESHGFASFVKPGGSCFFALMVGRTILSAII